ncbi:tspO/MBR family protein [Orientia chuto str. Dubai]|uniref:TspO/MBR family protein n=1 Tax=Orientia chuto str. Dubai TaxID=1359168 RepID=A0A0F3MIK0_9RICK|nr:TspO/MBR family protein [Candidatus Orientia mediorientalis]KJV55578.1 tspO/MBR family protein [Orientia chuto str. Dubai]
MNAENKTYLSLILSIVALIAIGGAIGSLTKPEISTWYSTLYRSTLTPPNCVFPVVWTILYGIIGACGWLIWRPQAFPKPKYYQNFIRDPAHLKLELDAFVFSLSLNRTFPYSFGCYRYSGLCAHLSSLLKNESGFAAYDSLSFTDSIHKLLKLLHMVV